MDAMLQGSDGEQALVERIIERVFSAILSGDLPLGSKLREKTLAQDFGVSRGPLREAIRSLEGRGLVERVPNLGPRVISLSTEDIVQIYIVREALEGMCCRIATELMSDGELISLNALVEKQFKDVKGGADPCPSDIDLDFHQRIVKAARNRKLERIIEGELYDLLRIFRSRSGAAPGRGVQSIEEHRHVVAAMLERDPALAESLMRRHIRNARANLIEQIMRQQSVSPLGAADAGAARRRAGRRIDHKV